MVEINEVLDLYFRSYRELIAAEQVGSSVVLSFPLHLAANHRIEITITRLGADSFIISDSARTLGEIEAAGYSLSSQMIERLEALASISDLRIVDTHIVLQATLDQLGQSIQKFLETTKTIGDVYLVHKQREQPDNELISQIRAILDARRMVYRLHEKVRGEIEVHPFDLVIPSNGRPGLALNVLGGQNTHSAAEIWGFRCDDIKRGEWYQKNRPQLALIYDVRYQAWSESSRAILESRADIAIPSDSLSELPSRVEGMGGH